MHFGHLDLLKFKTGVTMREKVDSSHFALSAEFFCETAALPGLCQAAARKLFATITEQRCTWNLGVDVEASSCQMTAIAPSDLLTKSGREEIRKHPDRTQFVEL